MLSKRAHGSARNRSATDPGRGGRGLGVGGEETAPCAHARGLRRRGGGPSASPRGALRDVIARRRQEVALGGARGGWRGGRAHGEFRGAGAVRADARGAGRQPLPGHLRCEQVRGLGLERGAPAAGARRGPEGPSPWRRRAGPALAGTPCEPLRLLGPRLLSRAAPGASRRRRPGAPCAWPGRRRTLLVAAQAGSREVTRARPRGFGVVATPALGAL